MKKQLKSFAHAFNGVWLALKEESHLRFHFVAALYVIVFSFGFDLSAVQWVIVLLLIAGVIGAELFNTALERLSDKVTLEYDKDIKYVKDLSAAAVLIFSAAAIVTAFLFYFNLDKISKIYVFIIGRPWLLILFIVSLIISIAFICIGPTGIKKISKNE